MKKIIILLAFLTSTVAVNAQWISDGEAMSSVREKMNTLKADVDTIQEEGPDSTWKKDGFHVYMQSILDSVSIGTVTPTEKLDVEGNIQGDTVIAKMGIELGEGAAATDYSIFGIGEDNTGKITYYEDEDAWLFEEPIHIPEVASAQAIGDYGALYTKTDDKFYFSDGAGTEHEVSLTEVNIGEMFMYEATQTITINTQTVYHAVMGFETGSVNGWTFDAGGEDVGGGINAEADATQLQVTTVGAHGLVTGDIVSLSGMNNAGHNAVTVITLVDATNFTCDDITYVAGAGASTGTADEPSYLLAGSGATGLYLAAFSISGEPQAADTYKWELNLDAAAQDQIAIIREHSNNDLGSASVSGFITATAGMRLFLTVQNTTGVNNFVIENANINLHRL